MRERERGGRRGRVYEGIIEQRRHRDRERDRERERGLAICIIKDSQGML